ncbi:hypothetical protein BC832DRAFT_565150 [Gaertneriomyces semiglobifer]|nr:hypothetical protein BC832DRAFT_565150 [Gaertneriomyces semiglobifer]
MDPVSNLEFWNYNDRPDYFVDIPDGDNEVERMIRVLRWWFAKDSKWRDQRVRKPYNSVLGERFLCWWDVDLKDGDGESENGDGDMGLDGVGSDSNMTLADGDKGAGEKVRVTCIAEQISHHPPVSAYYYECKDKGIIGRGVDHIAARFTGTNIKVGPGSQNHGIYITLSTTGEEYNIQHPWASITGWLSGSPYVIVGDSAIITCPKSGLKAVLEYKEESMFGKPKFAIEGKIFKYDYDNDKTYTEKERKEKEKLSKIKTEDVVARVWGQWNGKVYVEEITTTNGVKIKSEPRLIFDMTTSTPATKQCLPISEQHPMESRRIWESVTTALLAKDYHTATDEKRKIEDTQRKVAGQRHEKGEDFESWFFEFKGEREGRPGPPVDMDKAKPFLKKGREFVIEQGTKGEVKL